MKDVHSVDTPGGIQRMMVLSEFGIYRLSCKATRKRPSHFRTDSLKMSFLPSMRLVRIPWILTISFLRPALKYYDSPPIWLKWMKSLPNRQVFYFKVDGNLALIGKFLQETPGL